MTEQKRTLALSTRQWRVLLHDNLDVLKAAVQSTETLTTDGLREFCTHLDNMRMLAGAWLQVSPQPEVKAADVPAHTNGADKEFKGELKVGTAMTPPKKRRGRPSNAEIAARAVQ